jgi:hypothetical protein
MDKHSNLLKVTVDINNKFLFSWGNPTEDQHRDGVVIGVPDYSPPIDMTAGVIREPERHDDRHWVTMEGIATYFPQDQRRPFITLAFEGKNKTYVMMYPEIIPILAKYDIVRILKPQYFHQSRTGGRICVRKDGLEINLLTVIGNHYGIEVPSWSTRNCWRENPALVISQSEKPVGGTRAYMKAYYHRTAEPKRIAREEQKKAKILSHIEAKTRTNDIDDIIASLKGSGGGGPLPSASKLTILGRDIGRSDSRE